MTTATLPRRLCDLPLWRLIVLLDDTERTIGPDTQTARTIARIIQERLRALRSAGPEARQGAGKP